MENGELFPMEERWMPGYGIYTEKADYKAHVSFSNKTVYVFKPKDAIAAIKMHPEILSKKAYQNGVEYATAKGVPMPISYIFNLKIVEFFEWKEWHLFNEDLSTSKKGAVAVKCVAALLKAGKFPFAINAKEEGRPMCQLRGVDIIAIGELTIQVKCDAKAGITGNLYLQTHELNPRGAH
jgi:hypothetical protein